MTDNTTPHSIYNAHGHVIRTFHREAGSQEGVFEIMTPDIQPLIDANKQATSMGKGTTPDKSMRWIGRLHPVTIMGKLKEYGIPLHQFMQMTSLEKKPIYYRILREEPVWRTSSGDL